MKNENRMSIENYQFRYAEVMTVRCWTYLQLAIHFGNIPYVTQPLVSVSDLENTALSPVLPYEEVLQKLAECMAALPMASLDINTAAPLYAAVSSATDNVNLRMFLLNKHFVYGDILLYNDRFTEAATQYMRVIEEAEMQVSGNINSIYKCRNNLFQITNSGGLVNEFNQMFILPSTNAELSIEMINMFEYKATFAPRNTLVELFAPTGKGKYQLKPSIHAIDNLWGKQTIRNSGGADRRGHESAFAVYNGNPVVAKYLFDYYEKNVTTSETTLLFDQPVDENQLNGKWFLYRAALLHLRYAECANRAGYPDLADALLQRGIRAKYQWGGGDRGGDVQGIEYTGYPPATSTDIMVPYPAPFYMDGRKSTETYSTRYEHYNAKWSDHTGLRDRAYLSAVEAPKFYAEDGITEIPYTRADSVRWMEETLLQEAALECGLEGYRWGDMQRIARRKNKESAGSGTTFLNELLQKKFETEKKPAPVITLDNWFLKRD
jgi:hypothetical protein